MVTKPQVVIARCSNYDQNVVAEALHQSLELLGGLNQFVRPGQTVLVKVNALMAAPPEVAVTTHPAIVSAIVKEIVKLGAIALVGDSPGNATDNFEKVLTVCGIKEAAEKAGGRIVSFQEKGIVNVPSPSQNQRISSITVSKAVLDADIVINLPKLKTHGLTKYTGAIKNLFGCVPGFHKSQYHALAPKPSALSQTFVDLLEIVKPTLNIMDAVEGMEGNGPSAGDKRHFGAIFISTDAVALDTVCSAAIGFAPLSIATTRIAHQRKLGEGNLGKIEIIGERLESVIKKDWRPPVGINQLLDFIPDLLFPLLQPIIKMIRVDPVIDQKKCTKCLACVKGCPEKTIKTHPLLTSKPPSPSLDKRGGIKGGEFNVEIDLSRCIMCFCCHELCSYQAISLQPNWLARRIGVS